MCGILGAASKWAIDDSLITGAQLDTMLHRGPDDSGIWQSADKRVRLAHRRLAVIDLSSSARQPMMDIDEQFCITFNGEIYNYRELRYELRGLGHQFRSNSDTEVILEAYKEWGLDCVDRLNGMFAFGLYDLVNRRLWLVRDRAGEKPLFYMYQQNGSIVFASELKALMACSRVSRRINLVALKHFLAFGFVPGGQCLIRDMNKLPPGNMALFDLSSGMLRVWPYWELPQASLTGLGLTTGDDAELMMELEALLVDSVRMQLVADVPVGILLSGGIDSSLVTAVAAEHRSGVKTFTVRFPGYGAFDETDHARRVARHFATEHVELVAEPASINVLPKMAVQFDDPIVDSSSIPTYMLCQLVRKQCTVALTGDGGDELFGGYSYYMRVLKLASPIWSLFPATFRRMIGRFAQTSLPTGLKGRNWLMAIGQDSAKGGLVCNGLFDSWTQNLLLDTAVREVLSAEGSLEAKLQDRGHVENDPINRITRQDFHNFLPEDILVKVDRTSMLNSLEVRAPFLDHRLIEFAFGRVPSKLKVTRKKTKILPKMLGSVLLPTDFAFGRKQGFSIPLAEWLRGPWKKAFEELLFSNTIPIFDADFVGKIWMLHQLGLANGERLFAIAILGLWWHYYKITL